MTYQPAVIGVVVCRNDVSAPRRTEILLRSHIRSYSFLDSAAMKRPRALRVDPTSAEECSAPLHESESKRAHFVFLKNDIFIFEH